MQKTPAIVIAAQHIGGPKVYNGATGNWESAIGRVAVDGPIELAIGGLAGDSVADTRFHGSPDQAVCCHSLEHYDFWNCEFNLIGTPKELKAGAVGENWTLTGCDETSICVGDTFSVGSATVQVSQPRSPCWKQEAKTGLTNLLQRSIDTLKTGFYMRVLNPGIVAAGDSLILLSRPNPTITIFALCNFKFHGGDIEIARLAVQSSGISESWCNSFADKLNAAQRS